MGSGLFLVLSCIIEISVLCAKTVDTDQTPHLAASDLGLHCLPVSLLWNARHKWINMKSLEFMFKSTSVVNNRPK